MEVEVADAIQAEMVDRSWRVWPECPYHGFGLHPALVAGRGVWECRRMDHPVAEIGQLGVAMARLAS